MTKQARIDKGLWWDRALSLIEGCSHCSPGCLHCWSAKQAHIRSHQRNPKIQARYEGLTDDRGRWTGQIRLMHNDLVKPLKVRKPTTWAVWNDLWHEDVPFWYIKDAFNRMFYTPRHTYLILTKRPGRMLQWFDWCKFHGLNVTFPLPNVHLGVTVENQATADERIPILLQTPAAVRFLSCEPLLEEINIEKYLQQWRCPDCFTWNHTSTICDSCGTEQWENIEKAEKRGLDWAIVGCESGPHRRPCDLAWVHDLVRQGRDASVPVFVKQLDLDGRVSKNMNEWPADLRVREFPS